MKDNHSVPLFRFKRGGLGTRRSGRTIADTDIPTQRRAPASRYVIHIGVRSSSGQGAGLASETRRSL